MQKIADAFSGPTALRLNELEALEKVTEKIDRISVSFALARSYRAPSRLLKVANVIQSRVNRSTRRGSGRMNKAAIRIRIRQMCCLGLADELLVASLVPAIRDLVASDAAAYFWVDSVGEVTNAYADRLLSMEFMAPGLARRADRAPATARHRWADAALLQEGIVAINVDHRFAANRGAEVGPSAPGAYHVLQAIVRDPSGDIGRISLYRPARAIRFGPSDVSDLSSVMRYIAHGVALGRRAGADPMDGAVFHDSADAAMVVTDRQGLLKHATEEGRRMLLLASGYKINRATIGAASSITAELLRSVVSGLESASTAESSAPPAIICNTGWGRFVLRPCWLHDDVKLDEALVGIRIQRQEPEILKFVRAISDLPLSPQQREIALMIVQGESNRGIAVALCVSCNTVAYHVKQLFWKLDVHDRASLVARIGAGMCRSRPTRCDGEKMRGGDKAQGRDRILSPGSFQALCHVGPS